ncbi:MAG: OsmC family protein [Candidatus Bathyarchaeaceae archaeon]
MEKIGVELEYLGGLDFKVKFAHGAVDDLVIAGSRVSPEQMEGVSRKLLAASVAYCTTGWLFTLLKKTRVEMGALRSKAEVTMAKDESGRDYINEICLQVQVNIPDEDLNAFERCRAIVERGCLITRSLRKGIKATASISRIK